MSLQAIFRNSILGSCLVMLLVGCSGKTGYNEDPNFREKGSSKYSDDHTVAERVQFYGQAVSPSEEKTLRAKSTFYFDFDQYEVHQADLLSIYAHARYLITHPDARIRIDGHTDQLGSREYNIALGEKRANAVKNILLFKGALPSQIDVVSYGKEHPLTFDDTEEGHQQNRRAETNYVMNNARTR